MRLVGISKSEFGFQVSFQQINLGNIRWQCSIHSDLSCFSFIRNSSSSGGSSRSKDFSRWFLWFLFTSKESVINSRHVHAVNRDFRRRSNDETLIYSPQWDAIGSIWTWEIVRYLLFEKTVKDQTWNKQESWRQLFQENSSLSFKSSSQNNNNSARSQWRSKFRRIANRKRSFLQNNIICRIIFPDDSLRQTGSFIFEWKFLWKQNSWVM